MRDADLLEHLRAENVRLIALLETHGIEWRVFDEPPSAVSVNATPPLSLNLDTDAKLALFKRLFRGRTDVFPMRWESKTGKSGYSPVCANEWRPGICEKPRIKCGDCSYRQLIPLTDQVLYRHLAGEIVIGVYPLLPDDTCYFLAVDFDEADWHGDARLASHSGCCASVTTEPFHLASIDQAKAHSEKSEVNSVPSFMHQVGYACRL